MFTVLDFGQSLLSSRKVTIYDLCEHLSIDKLSLQGCKKIFLISKAWNEEINIEKGKGKE